jgi:hypothetical protein
MLQSIVHWLYEVMGRPGEEYLREIIHQCYYHPKLTYTIDRFKCEHCQKHNLSGKGFGLLLECEMQIAPWEDIAIGLIDLWTVKVYNHKSEFNTLTCIGTASNLVDLICINNKTSHHIPVKFVQCWLVRYPRPMHCVHDNDGEFT